MITIITIVIVESSDYYCSTNVIKINWINYINIICIELDFMWCTIINKILCTGYRALPMQIPSVRISNS